MNASEFRVGNLLECKSLNNTYNDRIPYYGDSIYSIDGILSDMVLLDVGYNSYIRVGYNEIKPIELTEEFIERLGFTKIKSNYEESETYDFFKENIYLDMANTSIKINNVYCLSFIPAYVHQLQNIFFALTGEELTFIE